MITLNQTKELVVEYFKAISGVEKTPELLGQYTTDQELINHIAFFDAAFPNYDLIADEMTSEGNRVVVRARVVGRHEGELNGIPPTFKEVDFPFVIGYEIEGDKIVDHWMVADQMLLLDQLGIKK
jgi:predicted ester cyclase